MCSQDARWSSATVFLLTFKEFRRVQSFSLQRLPSWPQACLADADDNWGLGESENGTANGIEVHANRAL